MNYSEAIFSYLACVLLLQNLLVNTASHILKLCDFGSAKQLVRGEPNISYICR